jgi:hypothetical protein
MSDDENRNRRGRAQRPLGERERFAHGLPGYHDPLGGLRWSATRAERADLCLVPVSFGLVVDGAGTVRLAPACAPVGFTVVLAVLAGIAVSTSLSSFAASGAANPDRAGDHQCC